MPLLKKTLVGIAFIGVITATVLFLLGRESAPSTPSPVATPSEAVSDLAPRVQLPLREVPGAVKRDEASPPALPRPARVELPPAPGPGSGSRRARPSGAGQSAAFVIPAENPVPPDPFTPPPMKVDVTLGRTTELTRAAAAK